MSEMKIGINPVVHSCDRSGKWTVAPHKILGFYLSILKSPVNPVGSLLVSMLSFHQESFSACKCRYRRQPESDKSK